LTICNSLPPKFSGQFVYKVVLAFDDPKEQLSKYFKECLEFVQTAIAAGGIVLVHCFSGVSRSATVVAYLMQHHSMGLTKAVTLVRSKRSRINPNPGFVMQLRKFEARLQQHRKAG
jgi:protein-tyrosine phosphatase